MTKYADLFRSGGKGDPDILPPGTAPESADPFTVLFVDDEEGVRSALKRIFIEENYRILTAADATRAIEILEAETVHLLISDHRMPGMTGGELLKIVRDRWPETIRIMLTGYADVNSIMAAVKEGAVYKFITKPWNDEDLRLTVSLALQQYTLLHENRKLKDILRTQERKIRDYAGLFDEDRGILGSILLRRGKASAEDVARAKKERRQGEMMCDVFVRLGISTEKTIAETLAADLGLDAVDLREYQASSAAVRLLPKGLCERNRMMALRLDGRKLTLAMADPSDIYKLDNLAQLTGFNVVPLVATSSEMLSALHRFHEGGEGDASAGEDIGEVEPLDEIDIVIEEDDKDESVQQLMDSSEVPPVIRIVNAIISEAIRYRASDIHVEPKTKNTQIRYRIDGLMHRKIRIPSELHSAVISRIKILAKMDISERRKPQDGRITVKAGTRMVDLRVSSMPTINGEKIVLRILDKSASIRKLEELGVLPEDMRRLNALMKKPQGVIITTGPTGSGKTTMLYSILAAMLESTKNFETIEEPVEYFMEEASQISVRDKIGLSFAQVLRSTLRQDPDVILVGEMRDFETADVAFKASLTGHMVLSTLHTNHAIASITRLIDMGIKPYIIASSLESIIAQRLVRKICPECRSEAPPDPAVMELLHIPRGTFGSTVMKGAGCDRCGRTGYQGRTGIYEIFVMNEEFRHQIGTSYKESEILDMARAAGMHTLVEDGIEKVRLGMTTLEEILRVVGPQTRFERRCPSCEKIIDARFVFCPYCGIFRSDYCGKCRLPLEKEWILCPFCGTRHGNRPEPVAEGN